MMELHALSKDIGEPDVAHTLFQNYPPDFDESAITYMLLLKAEQISLTCCSKTQQVPILSVART
jgi:hypothetical protein